MAVKTITLDIEAYKLLCQHKRGNQSFSQVVKEHFMARPNVEAFRHALADVEVSSEFLDAAEEQVQQRRSDRARLVEL